MELAADAGVAPETVIADIRGMTNWSKLDT